MSKRYVFYLLFFFLFVSVPLFAGSQQEFRGLWVKFEELTSKEKIDEVIENARLANINLIFAQVRRTGFLLYPSQIERKSELVKDDFDPVDYLITRAHQAKIEIHGWINTFFVWSKAEEPPSGHVSLNKKWLLNQNGNSNKLVFLNPANPEVQDYLLKVITELVEEYPLDGIHLDYIRYPHDETDGWEDFLSEKENQELPKTKEFWTGWRSDQITRLVEKIARTLTNIDPEIKLSAAVVPEIREATYFKGQNWPEWLKQGLLDFVVLMSYSRNLKIIQKQIAEAAQISGTRFIVAGLGVWRQTGPEIFQNIFYLRKLMQDKNYGSFKGFALFSYDHIKKKPNLFRYLKEKIFNLSAELPKMPWKKPKLSAGSSRLAGALIFLPPKN